MKKKEKFNKEHEEVSLSVVNIYKISSIETININIFYSFIKILKDIRQGLMQFGREDQCHFSRGIILDLTY